MPFDKTMFSRQARRAAARVRVAERDNNPDKRTRRERRVLASQKPPVTYLSPADLSWVAAVLESGMRVTITPSRKYRINFSVPQSPRLLAALRRKAGGYIDGNRWRVEGKRAEGILLALFNAKVALPKGAIHYLALKDYQRRKGSIEPQEAARIIAQAKGA